MSDAISLRNALFTEKEFDQAQVDFCDALITIEILDTELFEVLRTI